MHTIFYGYNFTVSLKDNKFKTCVFVIFTKASFYFCFILGDIIYMSCSFTSRMSTNYTRQFSTRLNYTIEEDRVLSMLSYLPFKAMYCYSTPGSNLYRKVIMFTVKCAEKNMKLIRRALGEHRPPPRLLPEVKHNACIGPAIHMCSTI